MLILLHFIFASLNSATALPLFPMEMCGCEEQSTLDQLKGQFMQRGQTKMWLGGVTANTTSVNTSSFSPMSPDQCSQECLRLSSQTSHFTLEGDALHLKCICYLGLNPFHCEEEEGVALVPVHCMTKPKSMERPLLQLLSRAMNTEETEPAEEDTSDVIITTEHLDLPDQQPSDTSGNLAGAALVLLLISIFCLVLMGIKTWIEKRKKRRQDKKKLSDSTGQIVSSVSARFDWRSMRDK